MAYAIIIILIIVLIKAIFSAADTAFTYINRAEIKQLSKTDKKAKKILNLMEDSNKFFGIIEVGINMAELFAGAVASVSIIEVGIAFLERKEFSTTISVFVSVTVVTIILAYVMLVFGGILPKRIARNKPKKTAYALINILWILSKLNYPFERLIDFSTNFFSMLLGLNKEEQERMTEKQLKMIIKEARDEGVLESVEKKILINTIKANDIYISKIMHPIDKTYLINIENDIEKILKGIKKNKYTRVPVYEKNKSNIIGIFNMKDIIIEYDNKQIEDTNQIRKLLREPLFIPKDEKLFKAFKKLQKSNQGMAIIKDENDIPVGLITIEDILERLVGKIFDEYDKVE